MNIAQAKQYIDEHVKPNGAGEITGTVMNVALNNICDAVSDTLDAVDAALQAIIG